MKGMSPATTHPFFHARVPIDAVPVELARFLQVPLKSP